MPPTKPIIGLAGGIGSGKSFVADLFGQMGCCVIKADEQVSEAYRRPEVLRELTRWWGPEVINRDGTLDRTAVARRVFADPAERKRLETLVHPIVSELRDQVMRQRAGDAQVLAFVWDAPLLFEAQLDRQCDVVVFVEAPLEVRLRRVQLTRGWTLADLESREKSQLPLDKKREMSKYTVRNTADADEDVRHQVREVLSRILADAHAAGR